MGKNMRQERPIFFFSDAHIGSRDQESEREKDIKLSQFFEYLLTVRPAPILYIVGDLFDFWFEYRYAIPSVYQKLLARMVHILDQGIEIRYVTGNHDFWMRDFFPKHLGIQVYHGIHDFQINGKRFFIFHGDGILAEDRGYRLMKKVLQHPLAITAYKWLHPDLGIPLARWASSTSRNHRQKTPEEGRWYDEKYLQYALEKMQEGYDYVVMGHTHRPVYHVEADKVYVNLGDWMTHFTYAVYDNYKLELKHWLADSENAENQEQFEAKSVQRLNL